ncbi:MAG: hypothetical protein JSR45_18075 [Proteobacteria bacterium]|nr:hypothetical protein [Pseudomonadota bacterium]
MAAEPPKGPSVSPPAADCAYDRKAMLALDFDKFDQDPAGWRALDHKPGCTLAAAELISIYRRKVRQQAAGLAWHEGQLRAAEGDYARAIVLMEESRADGGHDGAYVDATIAFLRRDKPALLEARARLAALPQPDGFAEAAKRYNLTHAQPLTWPMNLNVVDRLIRCYDQSYRVAYGGECASAAR